MKTLPEFKSTKVRGQKIETVFFCDETDSNDTEIYLYDDSCWIELIKDGQFLLAIGRDEWISFDLDYLENILYEWYKVECN